MEQEELGTVRSRAKRSPHNVKQIANETSAQTACHNLASVPHRLRFAERWDFFPCLLSIHKEIIK
jgi:hypothetical protein